MENDSVVTHKYCFVNTSPQNLKVPKCEIFDRSDFPDFYTSLRVGDFGVKIKNLLKTIFRGEKFLTRILLSVSPRADLRDINS